jgi:FAD dependent oxidoreductase TIGR03364
VVALENGWRVTVLERHARPLGASVRNFGALWPIGQPLGPERARALRSLQRWQQLSTEAGFACIPCGSLHLAYTDPARQVLSEFIAQPETHGMHLLTPEEAARRCPAVVQHGLRGALFSEHEHSIQPTEALQALVAWLQGQGVTFQFNTPAVEAATGYITTSDGHRIQADRVLVCCGDEVRLLFPTALQAAGGVRTRLQMLRTRPQPDGFRLGPIVTADLTLRHYASFRTCPSAPALHDHLAARYPNYDRWGIHVMAAQHPDGSVAIGDSHEVGRDFAPAYRSDIEALILDYLRTFLDLPSLEVATRWTGTYLKPPADSTHLSLTPAPGVQVITGLGGGGMTLAFARAKETVAAW